MQHALVDLRRNAPTTLNYLAQKPTCYEPSQQETVKNAIEWVRLGYVVIVLNTGHHTLHDVREVLQNTEGTSNDQVDWDVMFSWTLSQVDAT